MKKYKDWLYVTIAAVVIFVFGILCATFYLMYAESDEEVAKELEELPRPFSMYDWHTGTSDNIITVADICGKDASDDNVFLHVRDLGTDREVWFKIGDGVGLRWRPGFERITYTIKFSTEDYTTSHSSACTCVHNENGNVLRVDYPESILKLLYKEKKFNVTLLCKGKTVGLYRFDAIAPLVLD